MRSATNANSETQSFSYSTDGYVSAVTNGRGYTRTYGLDVRGEPTSLTLPDSSEEQWAYDGAGQTTAYVNPLGQSIDYVFDDAGRQTAVNYPTGTDTTFSYDNADRCYEMVDSTGTTSTTFDAAGEVTALNTPEGNMSYTFAANGQRATMVESAGTTTYSMDAAGRLTSLTNPQSETTSWSYDSDGRLGQQTFASGVKIVYGYDVRSRVTSISHQNSSSTVLSSESYSWDPTSNLSAKTVDSLTTSYGYDYANQLVSESNSGYSASYVYDANGNRSSQVLNGTTYTYYNDNADKLTAVKIGGTTVKSFSYDAAGRTTAIATSAGTTSLSYDYEGRVTGITYPSSATNSFTYNGVDARVGKTDSAGTWTYKRDGAGVTDGVLSDGFATYTPGVSRHASSTTTFEGGDYLGTNRVETNSTQAVSGTRVYDAFGNLESTTGSPAGPYGYAGQNGYQEDGDSGLKLLGERYYDPSTGHFLTRDPAGAGRNWYAYCDSNPLAGVDPAGLDDTPPPLLLTDDLAWDNYLNSLFEPKKQRGTFNYSDNNLGAMSTGLGYATQGVSVNGSVGGGSKKPSYTLKLSDAITPDFRFDVTLSTTGGASGGGFGWGGDGNKWDFIYEGHANLSFTFTQGPWGGSGSLGPGMPTLWLLTNGPSNGIYFGFGKGMTGFYGEIAIRTKI